jgi:hypothetical protein
MTTTNSPAARTPATRPSGSPERPLGRYRPRLDWWVAWWRADRGSVAAEVTIATPFLVMLLVFVAVVIHRGVDARLRLDVEQLPPTRAGKVRHRASAYFRMADGSLRLVRRQASTKGQATARLKEALLELATEAQDGDISKDTRFCQVVELWLDEIAQEAELGNLSPTTVSLYRRALKNWALPSLGQLRCREVLVTRCDKVIKKARVKASYAPPRPSRQRCRGPATMPCGTAAWMRTPFARSDACRGASRRKS